MAAIRTLSGIRSALFGRALTRHISTKTSTETKSRAALVVGSAVAGLTGYGVYKYLGNLTIKEDLAKAAQSVLKSSTLSAAALPASQPCVWTPKKDHALYLWIDLKPTANVKEVAKVAANLQKLVDTVVDPTTKNENDEVVAGVGFGPNFYSQVAGKTRKNYAYPYRKGALGDMPSSGGDVFVHAKCNQMSKLFELCQLFLKSLPKDSVEKAEDIYSFVYQNGRDLSGFIAGIENRSDEEGKKQVTVEKETGGSYVITQKWIHDLDVIWAEKSKTMEGYVGRERGGGAELHKKSITSHVARMTGGNSYQHPKPVEILRQSMPFGTVCGEAGLFFIAYAADPYNFEYMLDRMVGAGGDGHSDDFMKLTKNVKGTYWYFPGQQELAKLA